MRLPQPVNRTPATPRRFNKIKSAKVGKVFLNHSIRRRSGQTLPYFAKRQGAVVSQNLEELPLPLRKVMGHPMGRDVAAGQEAHPHAAGLLAELGLWVAGPDTQLDNLLRSPAPAFDDTAEVEDLGDQRVARL